MNNNLTKQTANQYEGNGWSRYQIMVLQQLDDHNKILQNLNKELIDLKQSIAVSEAELKIWRAQMMKTIEGSEEEISDILYGGKGLAKKIEAIDRVLEVENRTNVKFKATWAIYGAFISFFITTIIHIMNLFINK